MEDILTEIIKVEKEIRERIESEGKKSVEKIEAVKRDIEKEIQTEERRLEESISEAMKEARLNAEDKAKEIINSARAEAERLGKLSDEELKRIIAKHLTHILPEKR